MFAAVWKKGMKFFVYFLLAILIFIGSYLYIQSNNSKEQADHLLLSGRPAEAIELYKKAQDIFPFRSLKEDIAGAQLVLASKSDYDSISDFAEIQIPPPLANLPSTKLAPNELFVPILMYHHIEINPRPNDTVYAALYVSPDQLNQQLSYLSTHNFHTITLDELLNALNGRKILPPNPIILTFDDGYQSFYDSAYPLLKKYNMKAVQFVITQVEGAPAYLSWSEIVEMDKSGFVEIAAHTRHHPNLPDLSQSAIIDEILGSKYDLEQHVHHTINWFAYPYGSYNQFIIQTLKNAGFKGAVSTIYGTNQSEDNLYLLPRIMVDGRFSLDNITKRIQK